MGFKGMLTGLGLVTDNNPQRVPSVQPAQTVQPVATPAQGVSTFFANPATSLPVAADADQVSKLKNLILGTSPVIAKFMQNIEVVRTQFPNDENSCLKAALAFTQVPKNDLLQEMDRTVAAALVHAKKQAESDRTSTRNSSVGDLEKQSAATSADINAMQGKIVELQQSINNNQAMLTSLQQKIQTIEVDLQRQDAIINASFTEVENFITLLRKSFASL